MILLIFEKNDLCFRIVEVLKFSQTNVSSFNNCRKYAALSFRFCGDAEITYNGKSVRLRTGSVAFFPAGLDYYRKAAEDNLIVIHLEVLNYKTQDVEYFISQNQEMLYEQFNNIYNKWDPAKSDNLLKTTARVYRLFAEIFAEYTAADKQKNIYVENAKKYIEENYKNSDLTIRQVSESINICEGYLRKLFIKYIGCSPKKYLQGLRMNHAVKLLSMNQSVSATAEQSGFKDEKYFSVAFKKVSGVSPSHYCDELFE